MDHNPDELPPYHPDVIDLSVNRPRISVYSVDDWDSDLNPDSINSFINDPVFQRHPKNILPLEDRSPDQPQGLSKSS